MAAKKKKHQRRQLKLSFNKKSLGSFILILAAAAVVLILALGVPGLSFLHLTETNQSDKMSVPQKREVERLPENFPDDFPSYTSAHLTDVWTTEAEGGQGMSLIWESSDTVDKISAFYKNALPQFGWKVTSFFENEGSFVISFEKESVSGFVGISQNEKTVISVTLGW